MPDISDYPTSTERDLLFHAWQAKNAAHMALIADLDIDDRIKRRIDNERFTLDSF